MLMHLILVIGILGSFFASSEASANGYSWEKIHDRDNLYFLRDQEILNQTDVSQENLRLLEEINSFEPKANGRASGITSAQAALILRKMRFGPVVSSHKKYDPSGAIGFCFGRALYGHLELLRHGVAKESIKKVFVVGPMKAGGIDWQFHVAVMAKGHDIPGWYVIDTIMDKPIPLEQWFERFNGYSQDGKLRMYITKPQKIGPSAWEYNILPGGLFDSFYNSYFKDMFRHFKQSPLPEEQKFIQRCSKVLE